jgi:FKBP-type peptidyl-prolyl cis-trans isomerase FkpA
MRRPFALALSVGLVLATGCSDPIPEPDPAPRPEKSADKRPEPTELVKEDVTVGTGDREVKTGDEIQVHYTGRLWRNGSKFDSSVGKKPFDLKVGEGVIEGWSEGVLGMKKGGKRKLTIPAKLGYGDAGSPPKIPGKAALVFDIELLGWKDEAKPAGSGSAAASASAAPSADKPPKPKKDEKPKPPAPKGTGDAPK